MRSIVALLLLVFNAHFAFGQLPQWATYINDGTVNDIALEGDIAWVGSQGGLTKLNRVTGEKESFLPATINLGGFGVNDIAIAPDGTKWVGGQNGGLFRFDGINWEQHYYVNTGDTLNQIHKIRVAPNGEIWFMSTGHNFCSSCKKFFKFDGSSFTRMDDSLGLGTVLNLDIAPNGDIWAFSNEKLYRYQGQGQPVAFLPADIGAINEEEKFSELMVDKNGMLYLTTRQIIFPSPTPKSRMYKYDGNSWASINLFGESYWSGSIYRLFTDSQNNLWMTFSNPAHVERVAKYNGTDWQYWLLSDLSFLPSTINSIRLGAVDELGRWLAICSQTTGIHQDKVFEIDGTNWKSYSTAFYPMDGIYGNDIGFDCNDNAWICGNGFLNHFDGINWVSFKDAAQDVPISTLNLYEIEVDNNNCNIWISNSSPISFQPDLIKHDGTDFQLFYFPESKGVGNLLLEEDGSIWFFGGNKGLGHLVGNDVTWYDTTNSPIPVIPSLRPQVIDNVGGVWFIHNTNSTTIEIYRFLNGNWSAYLTPLHESITWMYKDDSGILWMGNYLEDPVGFDGVNWTTIPDAPKSTNMTQDAAGGYWFSGSTIAHYDGSDWAYYGVDEYPIGENYVHKIVIDSLNNKWFIHNIGISVYNENGINSPMLTPRFSVKGQVYYDANQDGTHAADSEPGLPGMPVTLLPENITTYSSFDGIYKMFPEPGNHQISLQPPAPFVPTSTNPLNQLMGHADQAGFDFGAWRPIPPESIDLDLTLGLARCSQTTNVWITPKNNSMISKLDGDIKLNHESLLEFISSEPPPNNIVGNELTWNLEDFDPYQLRLIKAVFQNPDASYVGEWLDFTAIFNVDGSSLSLSRSDATELRCSYDPNDKQSAPTGESVNEYSLLGDALDFTIRFQNKGNDTAFIVVIRDTLDADLDPTSFQLISSSHPVRVVLEQGRVLSFFFEGINLLWERYNEPASHGFVKYRIAPKPGLPDPTEIHNTAHIYFDLNPAIVTNTTQNILVETLPFLGTGEPLPIGNLLVYPNPSSSSFWVEPTGVKGPWSASIHDVYGRAVKTLTTNAPRVNVEGLPKGLYFVRMETGVKLGTAKVVVK